jgi:hypothetical protein
MMPEQAILQKNLPSQTDTFSGKRRILLHHAWQFFRFCSALRVGSALTVFFFTL